MDIFPSGTSISTISDAMGGNPNLMYSAFLLVEAHEYMRLMRESPDLIKNIDAATAAYLAHYPDREIKRRLFDLYDAEKKKPNSNKITASINTISEMMSCLSDVMEWTTKSYGGF
jgi:hypothetical protein